MYLSSSTSYAARLRCCLVFYVYTVFCRRYDDMRPMFSMYWFKRMEGIGVTKSPRNRRDGYIEEDFN